MGIPRAASLVRRIPRLTGANAATVIRRADERDDTEERPLAADTVRCRRPPPSPRPVPPGKDILIVHHGRAEHGNKEPPVWDPERERQRRRRLFAGADRVAFFSANYRLHRDFAAC